jgi:hypothetical protein
LVVPEDEEEWWGIAMEVAVEEVVEDMVSESKIRWDER